MHNIFKYTTVGSRIIIITGNTTAFFNNKHNILIQNHIIILFNNINDVTIK